MSNIFSVPLLLGLVAFLLGWAVAKFAAFVAGRTAGREPPEHHKTIRALEASSRVAQKDAGTALNKLTQASEEIDSLRISVAELESSIEVRDDEIAELKETLRNESSKVVGLRRELTGHAEETIRATVHARDAETELSVLKAGTSAMSEEVDRLAAEREDLTNRLKSIKEDYRGDDPAGSSSKAGDYVPDC